jgi:integrase/recombinase XerD
MQIDQIKIFRRLVVEKHLKHFLNLHLRVERGLSINTVENYRSDLIQFFSFLRSRGITPGDADYDTACLYVKKMHADGLKPSSMNRKLSAIRTFYLFLYDERIVRAATVYLVESVRRERRLPSYLTQPEMFRLIESTNIKSGTYRGGFNRALWDTLWIRDRAILELLYATGARISEITAVKEQDLDLETNTIKLNGKGNKQRVVPFGRYARRWIRKYLHSVRPVITMKSKSPVLFLGRNGRPMTRQNAWLIIKRAANISGFGDRVHPHIFRHSIATHLMNENMPLEVIARFLGHESINSTEVYTHVSMDRLRAVLEKNHPYYQPNWKTRISFDEMMCNFEEITKAEFLVLNTGRPRLRVYLSGHRMAIMNGVDACNMWLWFLKKRAGRVVLSVSYDYDTIFFLKNTHKMEALMTKNAESSDIMPKLRELEKSTQQNYSTMSVNSNGNTDRKNIAVKRVNVMLGEKQIAEVDKYAKGFQMSRSQFIRQALAEKIERIEKEISEPLDSVN